VLSAALELGRSGTSRAPSPPVPHVKSPAKTGLFLFSSRDFNFTTFQSRLQSARAYGAPKIVQIANGGLDCSFPRLPGSDTICSDGEAAHGGINQCRSDSLYLSS
jgi:hypothetical protein